MHNIILGIDLGTTYSVAAYVDDDGFVQIITDKNNNAEIPSAVLIEEDGRIAVGWEAMRSAIAKEDRVIRWIKRRMGPADSEYRFHGLSPIQISAEILKHIRALAEEKLGRVTDTVITVPAYFESLEVTNTRLAGEAAGFNVKEIIKEPTAAAVRHGIEHFSSDGCFLLCDLGGGTHDASVMRVSGGLPHPLGTVGSSKLGGHNWTMTLEEMASQQLINQFGVDVRENRRVAQLVYEECEQAKRDLSRMNEASFEILYEGEIGTVTIKQQEFEEATEELIQQVVSDAHEAVVRKTSIGWDKIEQIVLVGGSSRLRRLPIALQAKYRQETGREISCTMCDEPDRAVAKGAAIMARGEVRVPSTAVAAQRLATDAVPGSKSLKISVQGIPRICERNLGTRVYQTDDGGRRTLQNSAIIKQGTLLNETPSETREYAVTHANQKSIDVPVIEFDGIGPDVGVSLFRFHSEHGLSKGSQIDVVFEYNISGEINVTANDPQGRSLAGARYPYEDPPENGGGGNGDLNIVFLLDCSASMRSNSKITIARGAIVENAMRVFDKMSTAMVGVVAFSSSARTIAPLTNDLSVLRSQVQSAEPGGGTSLCDGLLAAKQEIETAPPGRRFVILVTDGMPTDNREEAVRIAHEEIQDQGVRLVALALGTEGVEESYIRRLTEDRFMLDDISKMGEEIGNFLSEL